MNKACFFLILFLICSCHLKRQKSDDVYTLRLKAKSDADEKVNRVIQQLRVDCDSNIFRMARQRADSLKLVQLHAKPHKKKTKILVR